MKVRAHVIATIAAAMALVLAPPAVADPDPHLPDGGANW
jgi:hypothetical protein